MALIHADDLHLFYGSKRIFEGDSLSVEVGDRLGIVGPNGAGKSTLLKILAGTAQPDAGHINRIKGLRVGYLPQELGHTAPTGLLESVLITAPGKNELENILAETEHLLTETHEVEEQMRLSERLSDLHTELGELHNRFGPHRAKAILSGLGFEPTDFDKPLSQFSGGWRMRGALAALLYQQPDVLLLDEPTNHLDLPSVHWLSGYLRGVRHAIVLTCHDREFLNRHVQRVASLELEGIKTFRGNYDDYQEQRTIQLAHLEARIEKEGERKKQLEAFVERFKAKATKARQAQSRVKMIEKMESDRIELPEIRRAMHVRFSHIPKCSERVLKLTELNFGYAEHKPLFSNVSLEAHRGDRIAIVGVNGAGKTTLLRLIAGELEPNLGQIEAGAGVEQSYFAQHHSEALAVNRTILEEVRTAMPDASETRLRSICGAVLFTGDEVEKPIAVLSGGEKARVALARMLAKPANLLLLDEPTNHLDTESAEVLTESLESFSGTILFVSHNLDFARRLSTKVWDVSGGNIRDYPGDLGRYLEHLSHHQAEIQATFSAHALEHQPTRQSRSTPKASSESKEARIAARTHKKKEEVERRRRQKALEASVVQAENEVIRLENEKARVESLLATPEILGDANKLRATSIQLKEITEALENAMDTWTEAEAQREAESPE